MFPWVFRWGFWSKCARVQKSFLVFNRLQQTWIQFCWSFVTFRVCRCALILIRTEMSGFLGCYLWLKQTLKTNKQTNKPVYSWFDSLLCLSSCKLIEFEILMRESGFSDAILSTYLQNESMTLLRYQSYHHIPNLKYCKNDAATEVGLCTYNVYKLKWCCWTWQSQIIHASKSNDPISMDSDCSLVLCLEASLFKFLAPGRHSLCNVLFLFMQGCFSQVWLAHVC